MLKWSGPANVVKSTHKLPPNPFSGWNPTEVLSKNLVASSAIQLSGLAFLHIPPFSSQKAVEGWSFPPFPFKILDFTAYAPENVLAVAELKG